MTEAFSFPVLSLIIFVPIIAGVIILFIPKEQKDLVRGIAFTAAAIILGLGIFVFASYNNQVASLTNEQATTLQGAGQDLIGLQPDRTGSQRRAGHDRRHDDGDRAV